VRGVIQEARSAIAPQGRGGLALRLGRSTRVLMPSVAAEQNAHELRPEKARDLSDGPGFDSRHLHDGPAMGPVLSRC